MRSFCDQAVIQIEKLKAEVTNLRATNDTLQNSFNTQLAGTEGATLAAQLSKSQEVQTKLLADKISKPQLTGGSA